MALSNSFRSGVLLLFVLASAACAQTSPAPLNFAGKTHFYFSETFNTELALWTVAPAALELISSPRAYPREWRSGMQGLARNTGDYLTFDVTLATTRFAVGALLHEDPRYFRSQSRNVILRAAHAVAFTVFDRDDRGRVRMAVSNLAGAGAAGFIENAYRPAGFNDAVHGGQGCVFAIVTIAAGNLWTEFHPELRRGLRRLHIPVGKD